MNQLIFHVDMDAFFVSVEELFRPELKGKPVIVGGDPNHRGVVAAASYEVRKFGVHSAMPLSKAKALCPHAIFLRGQHEKYQDYSRRVRAIFCQYSPVVEMASIDEAYLDFSGAARLYGHPFQLAHRLRSEIARKTGLSASIGLSRSKLVSKVASDLAKPAGILHVWPGCESAFLAPLPVRKLPGIGKKTEDCLHTLGVCTVADLASLGAAFLSEKFGLWGESLYRKSQGLDTAHFEFREEPKSISHETTFDADTSDIDEVEKTLAWLVQKVAHRLREHKMFAGIVTLKLRYADFKTLTRAESLDSATQLDPLILDTVLNLLKRTWDRKRLVRLLGVGLSGLTYSQVQEDLFEKPQHDKLERLLAAADKIRDRYGFESVTSARTVK